MDYFDLHCDTVLRLCDRNERLQNATGCISMEKAAAFGQYAQVYALFVHDKLSGAAAWRQYQKELACIQKQEKLLGGAFRICKTANQLNQALSENARAAILSIENGKALAGQIERVEQAAADGIRLLTLTWFGENELGCGSGVGGPMKEFGIQVLKECRRVGIVPDISHLSDEGVAQVFAEDDGVLIASHSNARSVTGHFRNLTDEMIEQIKRRRGLIGINFCAGFLRSEEHLAGVEDICRHVLYFLQAGCEDVLAFGSDFDGAHLPQQIASVADVCQIYKQLFTMGVSEKILQKIFFENARLFFERNLGGKTI